VSIRGLTKAAAQTACAALLLSGASLMVPASAEAAGTGAARVKEASAAKVVAKEPEATGSVAGTEKVAAELQPNCAQSRKRLWVEGEGWVVRRVTTCF
jgi:hypothetical protein